MTVWWRWPRPYMAEVGLGPWAGVGLRLLQLASQQTTKGTHVMSVLLTIFKQVIGRRKAHV